MIFMRSGDELVPLTVAPYEAEKILQALLEKHPQLLAGAQMNRVEPPRFLLVRREAAVTDREDGGGRWSLDHLFLDQLAIPTLVEVKRSTDTRIRREVVGQMLDYAANGPRYWPQGHIQSMFEDTCQGRELDPDEELAAVIGPEADIAEYWAEAERNLRAGRLRLVFVADVIPTELQAIIEFLHARMPDTDVYGVEVHRYVGVNGAECLVPRLVGNVVNTEPAKRKEHPWDEDSFFEQLRSDHGNESADVAGRLKVWATQRGFQVVWGAGSKRGTMNLRLPGATFAFLNVRTDGRCSMMWGLPTFLPERQRVEVKARFLKEMNALLGLVLPQEKSRLIFRIDELSDPARFEGFCAVLDQVLRGSTVESSQA